MLLRKIIQTLGGNCNRNENSLRESQKVDILKTLELLVFMNNYNYLPIVSYASDPYENKIAKLRASNKKIFISEENRIVDSFPTGLPPFTKKETLTELDISTFTKPLELHVQDQCGTGVIVKQHCDKGNLIGTRIIL